MPGMKRDCGGAAGILGAFYTAVKMVSGCGQWAWHRLLIVFINIRQGFTQNLHAVLCLAENAVGPIAARPDDIHTLYSGRGRERRDGRREEREDERGRGRHVSLYMLQVRRLRSTTQMRRVD